MGYIADLRARAQVRSLLSAETANPKVAKNSKLGQLTAVLHLAPGNMSGHEVCPKRSPGCSAACLHFAGSPVYQSTKDKSRIARTQSFFRDRNVFMNLLVIEMANHIKNARDRNLTPSFRLNGTSDIVWEKKKFILFPETAELLVKRVPDADREALTVDRIFPTIQFYDYTAIPGRKPGDNYHLTFSLKEQNMNSAVRELQAGKNIAVVYQSDEIPDYDLIAGKRLTVINGDEHDFRPKDPSPCIVGLKVKGVLGNADQTGFVQRSEKSPGDLAVA